MANWIMNNYEDLINILKAESVGEKFCLFQKKIVNTKLNIFGVKVPILRKLAKQICKEDKAYIFKQSLHNSFEEILLEGFVLAEIKNR